MTVRFSKEIEIEINSMLEIPMAYQKAIEYAKKCTDENPETGEYDQYSQYAAEGLYGRDFFDGEITLIKVSFENNHKRTCATAHFLVTDGASES